MLQGEVKDYHSGARKTTYNQHGVTSDLEKVVIGEKVASITPYKCTAWSRGALLSNEDTQFRCDDAHRKDNEYQCGPGGKYRKFARKEWVTKVTVVMDKDTAGNLKTPSKELCSYEYMIEEHSADDWKTALSKCEDDVPEKDGSPTTYDLTVLVRSEADPYVVAGSLSECKYNFGPTAAEHLEAAIGLFAGAAFGACGFALVYVARQRKLKQQAEQMASQQQMYALQQQGGVPMQAVPPGQYAQPMQPYPPQPYQQQPYPQHQVYAPQGYPAQGYPVQGPQ